MKIVKRLVVVLVVLGLIVFFGVPFLLGTSWAKDQIQESMAKETGRDVEIGGVKFSWFSGLQVFDVTVQQLQPGNAAEGPLFKLASLNLEVGIGDVLKKKINVKDFTVDEPRIVVVREADGTWNFGDLLDRPSEDDPTGSGGGKGKKPPAGGGGKDDAGKGPDVSAKLRIRDGNILVIDKSLGTRVEFQGIDTNATWTNGKLVLDMGGILNGGDVSLKAEMDLSQEKPPFTVKEFRIDGTTLGTNLAALGAFIPVMGVQPQTASGTIRFSLSDVSGRGFSKKDLRESLSAAGGVQLEGGVLASGAIAQLVNLLTGGEGAEGISVKLLGSTFSIADGKITTKDLKIEGKNFDLRLEGWTNLGGKIDYTVTASRLDELIGKNAKLKEYLGEDGTMPLRLTGTLDSPKLEINLEGAVRGAIDAGIEKGIGNLFGGDDDDEDEKKKRRKKNRKKNREAVPDAPEVPEVPEVPEEK